MDTSYYDFTGVEMGGLRQVVLTKPLPSLKPGTVGGYILDESCLGDGAWLDKDSFIYSGRAGEHARLLDTKMWNSTVMDSVLTGSHLENCDVRSSTLVGIDGHASTFDWSILSTGGGSSLLSFADSEVSKARMRGVHGAFVDSQIYLGPFLKNMYLELNGVDLVKDKHFLKVGPVGSENNDLILCRNKEGKAQVTIGCWEGLLDEVMPEVYRRREEVWMNEDYEDEMMDLWEEQYESAVKMCQTWVKNW